MEPVTTVKTVFNEQLAYPDVYLCIPAGSMVEIYQGRRNMVFAGGSNDDDYCPVTMAFLAPDLNSRVSCEEECVGTVTEGHEDPNADLVKFGTTAVPVGNDVKELVETLPTAEVHGQCINRRATSFSRTKLPTLICALWSERSSSTWMLETNSQGQVVLFELAVDEFKDETEGDEDFHNESCASQTAQMNQLPETLLAVTSSLALSHQRRAVWPSGSRRTRCADPHPRQDVLGSVGRDRRTSGGRGCSHDHVLRGQRSPEQGWQEAVYLPLSPWLHAPQNAQGLCRGPDEGGAAGAARRAAGARQRRQACAWAARP